MFLYILYICHFYGCLICWENYLTVSSLLNPPRPNCLPTPPTLNHFLRISLWNGMTGSKSINIFMALYAFLASAELYPIFPTALAGIEYYFNRNTNQLPEMVFFFVSSVCLKWHPIVFFLSVFEAKWCALWLVFLYSIFST